MVRTKRERSCAQCGAGFSDRGNRAEYCTPDCKRLARNHRDVEWYQIKRQLVPLFKAVADADPGEFWEQVRTNQDILSVYPEVRRPSNRPNGATGWDDSEGETANSGRRYMPADPDRPDIQWSQHDWTTDNFIDNYQSSVCVRGAFINVWVKLENVTHRTAKPGVQVWELPYAFIGPTRLFRTIEKRGEGCKHYVNGVDPIHDCQACGDRWSSRGHSDRNTHPADDLCLHDMVPSWCAWCIGLSRESFVNEAGANWSQVNRLNQLLNTPREVMNYAEHKYRPGVAVEDTRTSLDLLQDETRAESAV